MWRSLAVSCDSVLNEPSGWRRKIVTLAVAESTTQYSRPRSRLRREACHGKSRRDQRAGRVVKFCQALRPC